MLASLSCGRSSGGGGGGGDEYRYDNDDDDNGDGDDQWLVMTTGRLIACGRAWLPLVGWLVGWLSKVENRK